MTLPRGSAFVLALAVLLAPSAGGQAVQNIVLRNSFNPIGAGARGLGMGGAFIGVADDGTAASFNPAGLAQLRRSELAAVGFDDHVRTTRADLASGRTLTESARHRRPDFFGLAVPFDAGGRNLTVQLSYQRAVDLFGQGAATTRDTVPLRELGIALNGNADVRGEIAPEQEGAFETASVSAAYQATRRLSLGLTLNYWFADWTARGRAVFAISGAPPAAALIRSDTRSFVQKQSVRALSLNTGMLLRYPWLSLGGVLRLPFGGRYELEETGQLVTTTAGRGAVSTPVAVSMENTLDWPLSAGLGLALRPLRGLTLAGDYSKSYWSRATLRDVVDGALLTAVETAADGSAVTAFRDRNFFDLNPASLTATEDTTQRRAGIEYLVTVPRLVIPLRAGVFRDESPVRDLSSNEARRIEGWTLGTGLNFSRVVLDVAFERRRSEGVVGLQLRRGQGSSAASTERVREDRIVASLILRLGADDPIKRLLRRLFVGPEESGDN